MFGVGWEIPREWLLDGYCVEGLLMNCLSRAFATCALSLRLNLLLAVGADACERARHLIANGEAHRKDHLDCMLGLRRCVLLGTDTSEREAEADN